MVLTCQTNRRDRSATRDFHRVKKKQSLEDPIDLCMRLEAFLTGILVFALLLLSGFSFGSASQNAAPRKTRMGILLTKPVVELKKPVDIKMYWEERFGKMRVTRPRKSVCSVAEIPRL